MEDYFKQHKIPTILQLKMDFRKDFTPNLDFFFDELQSCANEQSFLEYKLLSRVVHLDFSLS